MLLIQLTMTTSWLALLPPLFPCCLSLQCCRKGQQDQVLVQVSPMIVGKARQEWAVFDLRVRHQYQPLHELLSQHCCWMLPKSWDLAHWHYWKWCCCYWLKSLRQCQLCCCWWPFQGGKGKEGSWLGPEAGAHYCPDDGWGAGAVAACRSSPPAVGGGSSCGHCGTWFCRTSWSKKKKKRQERFKWSKMETSCYSLWKLSTHLPHSLQGKKLASGGTGTTSSRAKGLFTGWQVAVVCQKKELC